jgi:hypothetical protein
MALPGRRPEGHYDLNSIPFDAGFGSRVPIELQCFRQWIASEKGTSSEDAIPEGL